MTFAEFLKSKHNITTTGMTQAQMITQFPQFFAAFEAEHPAPTPGDTPADTPSADPFDLFGGFDFSSLFGGQGQGQTFAPSTLDLSALSSGAGPSTVAAGFPLFESTLQLLLQSNQQRLASIDQSIQIAQLFAELDRVSPTRAADIAVQLGLNPSQDFSFVNQFGRGQTLAPAAGGRVGGQVGGQNVSVPGVFGGQELSFLGANPNVARVAGDVAAKFGLPDIFARSASALIPTSGSLLGQIS